MYVHCIYYMYECVLTLHASFAAVHIQQSVSILDTILFEELFEVSGLFGEVSLLTLNLQFPWN